MTHAGLAWASYCGNRAASLAGDGGIPLHNVKPSRPAGWPFRRRLKRQGATPEFAEAMARLEFGKYYPRGRLIDEPTKPRRSYSKQNRARCDNTENGKPFVPWQPPRVRERRSELAAGMARLSGGRKGAREDDPI